MGNNSMTSECIDSLKQGRLGLGLGKSAWAEAEGMPMQGIFAVACSPKMLEVAKHDMGRPAASPIPRMVGRGYGQGVKPKQLV